MRKVSKMIKIFLVFMNLICFSYAQFDQCDVVLPISSAGRSVFVKNIGKNCRYQIIAPVDTTIEASCTFNLPGVNISNFLIIFY